MKSSGKFFRNVSSVDPGLPKTVVSPSERSRSYVTSRTVFWSAIVLPVPSCGGALRLRRDRRAATTLVGRSGAVDVMGDNVTRPPLFLVSSTKC